MTKTLTPDVLIIGASVAGVAAAMKLHRQGLEVLLIERDAEVKDRFKGEFLQPFAVKTLRRLGLSAVVDDASITKIRKMRFRELRADNQTVSASVEIKFAVGSFAAVLPHKKLIGGLRACAEKALGERFFTGATAELLNANHPGFELSPEFSVKTRTGEVFGVKPKWVLGCDGRQSTVRKWMGGKNAPAMGAPTLGTRPEFIVGCELKGAHRFNDRYEVIRTGDRGTLAIFRLSDESRRCYWSTPVVEGQNNKKEWDGSLRAILDQTQDALPDVEASSFDNVAGNPADTVWLGPAARGRFLLLGDALAVTTPFGGQGMTCAMHHVEAIGRLIQPSDPSENEIAKIGKTYNEKAVHWFNHINLINFGLYYLFFSQNSAIKAASRHVLRRWNRHPEMADRVGRLFAGDDLDTPGILELLKLWGMLPSFVGRRKRRESKPQGVEKLRAFRLFQPDQILTDRPFQARECVPPRRRGFETKT